MKILAIIPARKDSKRLPDKNTMLMHDKTLIDIAINEALSSNVSQVLVTTNDEKVKDIASRYNVIIHDRDESLCTDTAKTKDVIIDITKTYKFDCYVLLQPTSPLRNHKHINEAISKFKGKTIISTHKGHKNGAIYIFKNNITKDFIPYEMDGLSSVDIDTKDDFNFAREIYYHKYLNPDLIGG